MSKNNFCSIKMLTTLLLLLFCTTAFSFVIYNGTPYKVHVWVNPGDFDVNINAKDHKSCNYSNKDCNPTGKQTSLLTAQIEISDVYYNCVISLQGGGYITIDTVTEAPGVKPVIVCRSYNYDNTLVATLPYFTPNQRSIYFVATGDPQINLDDKKDEKDRIRYVVEELVNRVKQEPSTRGILVSGDLTMNTKRSELDQYKNYMSGFTRFAYDGTGNHDCYNPTHKQIVGCKLKPSSCIIPEGIRNDVKERKRTTPRTGGKEHHYSWDWCDVHFVQLNLYPGNGKGQKGTHDKTAVYYRCPFEALAFVEEDLRINVGNSGRPVVLIHHYGFDSFSRETTWWTDAEINAYWNVLAGYNVATIVTGHLHTAAGENWWKQPWKRPVGLTNGPDSIPTFIAGGARNGGYYIDMKIQGSVLTARRFKEQNVSSKFVLIDTQTVPIK